MCKPTKLLAAFITLFFAAFTVSFAEELRAAAPNLELLYAVDKLGAVFKAYPRPGYEGISHPLIVMAKGIVRPGDIVTTARQIGTWDIYSVFTGTSGEQYLKAHVEQGLFDPVVVTPDNPLPHIARNVLRVAEAGVSLEKAIEAAGALPGPIVGVQLMWPIGPYREFVYFIATQPPILPTTKTIAVCTGVTETESSGIVRKCS